jgi:hypothetical protein
LLSSIPQVSDLKDVVSAVENGSTAAGSGGSSDSAVYATLLTPSNNSGALGAAAVHFDQAQGTVTIAVEAHGLTPDQIHPQHIHGFENGSPSHPPTINQDTDIDGFVESMEAEAAVGPVIMAATQSGTVTSTELSQDFPSADANGNLSFVQSYHFNLSNSEDAMIFQELQQRVAGRGFEIHGLDIPAGEGAGTPGEVNGTGGYIPAVPVTGGILTALDEHSVAGLLHDGFFMA